MVTKETIEQFLRGECDAKQARVLQSLFEEKPELFAQFINEAEWEEFVANRQLSDKKSEEVWRHIHHEVKRKPLVYYIKRFSVAASLLIGMLAVAYYVINSTATNAPELVDSKRAVKTIYNGNVIDEFIALSDSSYVWLMPGSSISYPDSFYINRTITLSGGAYFEVKRDPAHPFVVTTDSVNTIVLGTRFTVKGNPANGNIEIALHEGKVSVEKNGIPFNGSKSTYILHPGEIFSFTALNNRAFIEKKEKDVQKQTGTNNSVASNGRSGDTTPNNIIQGDNWYMFNNQSLAQTFDQLEQLYNTKITYNKADIKGMTFIGKVDNSDSLYNILKAIALLNNLKVVTLSDGYVIKK